MHNLPLIPWRGLALRWHLLSALLAAAVGVISCGGGDRNASSAASSRVAARVGTGTVAQYEPQTQTLMLPQLQAGGTLHSDVKLRLQQDGTWALQSKGSSRASTDADQPAAKLNGVAGASTDLQSAQLDGTLTVTRLHVGARVFGSVAIKLAANKWALASPLQETKTLHAEDFKSSAAISADESHHVVLKSHPAGGVQTIPMRLSARSYRFCMDAQAQGADTTTLIGPTGATVFTLKAGDACVSIKAAEGDYRFEHRYGGSGATRTVFMRHAANTTAATKTAATKNAVLQHGQPQSARAQINAMTAGALKASNPLSATEPRDFNSPGTEYWLVTSPGVDLYDGRNHYLSHYSYSGVPCRGPLQFAGFGLTGDANGWGLGNSLLRVEKDSFTQTPLALGSNIFCTDPAFTYFTPGYVATVFNPPLPIYPNGVFAYSQNLVNLRRITYDPSQDVYPCCGLTWPLKLSIRNQQGNQFQLFTGRNHDAYLADRLDAQQTPYIAAGPGGVSLVNAPAGIDPARSMLTVRGRFFPAGISAPLLAVGEMALYGGPNCTGPALVTTADTHSSLTQSAPGVATYQSIQLGLSTRALVSDPNGNIKYFNQLNCTSIGTDHGTNPPGIPDEFIVPPNAQYLDYHLAIVPILDTIEIVLSTNACEGCNLTGADFTGIDLTNVKLSRANLSSATLTNRDLSGADLRFATLQGTDMTGSNLEGANLCNAVLNASQLGGKTADLTKAHLKNTNLSGANLIGVSFINASFFSSGQPSSCQQTTCDSYEVPRCAGASGAFIHSAKFGAAYIANADMSGVKGLGVDFSNATLIGVSLANATLGLNTDSGSGAQFINANLQGTDFTNATLSFTSFSGAQMDLASTCGQKILPQGFSVFPGAKAPVALGSATCATGVRAADFCVMASWAASPGYPATDCTNTCADNSVPAGRDARTGQCTLPIPKDASKACSDASWTSTLANSASVTNRVSACTPDGLCTGSRFKHTSGIDLCW